MAIAIRNDLRRQIVAGHYAILKRTRKRIKGLRLGCLWSIELLGCNPDGCTMTELARFEGIAGSSVMNRLRPAICYGFVCKEGVRYKLTDKGREAFAILEEEF